MLFYGEEIPCDSVPHTGVSLSHVFAISLIKLQVLGLWINNLLLSFKLACSLNSTKKKYGGKRHVIALFILYHYCKG